MNQRLKILFIAMPGSIHTARWINLLKDQPWDIYLYPSITQELHEDLQWISFLQPSSVKQIINATTHNEKPIFFTIARPILILIRSILRISFFSPLKSFLKNIIFKKNNLAKIINEIKPDLIHTLEFQAAGYMALETKLRYFKRKSFPLWLATNWGSDIYYFRKFTKHKEKITQILQNIDFYSCELQRDLDIAHKMGLKAPYWPILPNTGGFHLEKLKAMRNKIPPSKRKYIMIKGYVHFAGKALRALKAIEMVQDLLENYKIIVYLGQNQIVEHYVEKMFFQGIDIRVIKEKTHDQMMELHANSRIHLAVSISDGISTAMIEAMVMGSFPIQTDTSGAPEWLSDGVTGFIVPPDDINYIANCLRKALINDELVDKAAQKNWQVAQERLDYDNIKKEIIEQYKKIFLIS